GLRRLDRLALSQPPGLGKTTISAPAASGRRIGLRKGDAVAGRIDNRELGAAPLGPHQTGPAVLVVLRDQLVVQADDAADVDPDVGAGRGVAMMLGDVQEHPLAAHLHVERQVGLEAVLPVDREAEKAEVEFASLGLVEAPQDRNGAKVLKRHRAASLLLGVNPRAALKSRAARAALSGTRPASPAVRPARSRQERAGRGWRWSASR